MTIATDAGHWYAADGSPRYTLVGKNGRERNTTLRDARELGLYPSVTTIIRAAAAPGLDNWKQDQAILAALTLPRREGESEAAWLARVKQDAKETARKAADRGSEIHGAIERHFQGIPPSEDMHDFVKCAVAALAENFGPIQWDAERSFTNAIMGYGGKCDLHSKAAGIVIDFKGKDFEYPSECRQYDEHLMQGAAYLHGLGMRNGRFANVFISRNNPGTVCVLEANPADIARGWRMFQNLLAYWQEANSYRPIARCSSPTTPGRCGSTT